MKFSSTFRDHISGIIDADVLRIESIPGGDISEAYKLSTQNRDYFIKMNSAVELELLFEAEAFGLETISRTKTIATPELIAQGHFENISYLILNFVDAKSPSAKDMAVFGDQLAMMHCNESFEFGLESDNFIGSLHQSNKPQSNWVSFFTEERLVPQIELAKERGYLKEKDIPSPTAIYGSLQSIIQNVKPSLLHGDLWSGNYLIDQNGGPILIDPAIYYGDADVDISMSLLFGGFGEEFYSSYLNARSINQFNKGKIELYQLYYLLVHLNLFGASYYNSVSAILKKYF